MKSPENPIDRSSYFAMLQRFVEVEIRFNAALGMLVDDISVGRARLRIPFKPEWLGDPFRPALHGGLVSTLADTAGGVAVFSQFDALQKVSTVDLRVDYLRHGLEEDLICDAKVLRLGNRVAVTSMVVFQQQGDRVVAEGRGVYNINRSESGSHT
jgi:uncharacterized protein (TIGR00369 family)